MSSTTLRISRALFSEISARFRTSSATTANPRPCSPARAASMAAFRASKLVWSAIRTTAPTISPICSEFFSSSLISLVDSMFASALVCTPLIRPSISMVVVLIRPCSTSPFCKENLASSSAFSAALAIWLIPARDSSAPAEDCSAAAAICSMLRPNCSAALAASSRDDVISSTAEASRSAMACCRARVRVLAFCWACLRASSRLTPKSSEWVSLGVIPVFMDAGFANAFAIMFFSSIDC